MPGTGSSVQLVDPADTPSATPPGPLPDPSGAPAAPWPSPATGEVPVAGATTAAPLPEPLVTPDMIAALTAMAEQRKGVGFQNAKRFWASQNTGSSTGAWPFIDGAVSITYDGQWRVEEIRKYKPDMDYRVWPIPPPAGGNPLPGSIGGNFMIIPAAAKNKKGAFEWLKFWSGLTNPNRAAKFENWGGWIPLSPDVAHSPTYEAYVKQNPRFQTFIDILDGPNVHAYPPVAYLGFLIDELQRAEDAALRGSKTPKEALDQLQKNVQKELAKRKEMGFDDSL